MKPSFDLAGRVVAVTGAAGILCSEMAIALAECGCKVALLDLNEEKAKEVAARIVAAGGEAEGYGCSVLDKDSITKARDAIIERFGKVDALVNGAGGNHPSATVNPQQSFFDLPEDALSKVMSLNLNGTILPSQIFGEVFMKQGSGNILNITSMCGVRPLTNVVGYSAAKAAVVNFTQWLASYFPLHGCAGVRVNAIAPGFLLTEQNRFLLKDKETGEHTPRSKHILQQTPMGRYGEAQELVGAIVFLLSDAASFITGVVLPIDGGFSVYSI